MKPAAKPRGRPTKFEPRFVAMAQKVCRMGATNADLAELFEVDVSTVDEWIAKNKDFRGAVNEGRLDRDTAVERSLYERAMGYSHPAVKIFNDKDNGVTEVPYTERYPPDPTSMIFWLKNRQPARWREKLEVEHGVSTDLGKLLADRKKNAA